MGQTPTTVSVLTKRRKCILGRVENAFFNFHLGIFFNSHHTQEDFSFFTPTQKFVFHIASPPHFHFRESFLRLAASRFHRFSDVDTVFYLSIYIPLADRSENIDDRDDDDDEIRETADARDGTDGQTVDELPEMNDASQNEPKRRYGSKEPKAATSKRRQKDSVEKQDTGAKKAKSKAPPAKKLRPV